MWEFLKSLLHAKPDPRLTPEPAAPAPRSTLLDNFRAEEAGDAEPDAMPAPEKKPTKASKKKESDEERAEAAYKTLTKKE